MPSVYQDRGGTLAGPTGRKAHKASAWDRYQSLVHMPHSSFLGRMKSEKKKDQGKQEKESRKVRTGRVKSTWWLIGIACGFAEAHITGPRARLSGLAGGGWGLLLCIYNEFPGNADAAGKRGTEFENRPAPGGAQKGASGTYLFQDQFMCFTFWFSSDKSYNVEGAGGGGGGQHFKRMK